MSYKPINPTVAVKLRNWWQQLEDNRAEWAALRRASFIDDILPTPAFFDFLTYIYADEKINFKDEKFIIGQAVVASILARVKEDLKDAKSFAKLLAKSKENSNTPVMSKLRFEKLIKSDDPEQFFIRIRRAVDLLKGRVNIISLANGILHWIHNFYQQDESKERKSHLVFKWATDYYTTVNK